jgi:hypothetical protein
MSARAEAILGESNNAPRREWVALQTTMLKASKVSSAQLSDSEKLVMPVGTRLNALLSADDGDHWFVKEATVDGVPTPDRLGYIFKAQWKIEGGVEGGGAPKETTVTFADYAEKQAKHRRLYAAFRRRLSH